MGSVGDDVRQLQMFLNGDPRTQLAVSGVGSPGNESRYYGRVTQTAVRKYQELPENRGSILESIGLSAGTGAFYTSTRNHMNSNCRSAPVAVAPPAETPVVTPTPTPTAPPVQVRVSGDSLAVTAGKQPGDSYAVLGAQRVPFTSFVLTAGSDDVRIEGIRVRRYGLSSSDNFESVALVDTDGVQIGSARSLNSRHEAVLGGNFVLPRNRSITLVVVGNITSDEDELSGGAVAGLEVVEVSSEVDVDGRFPIRGAAHVMSEGITLSTVMVDVDSSEDEIEFDTDTEVVTVDIRLSGSGADKEDAYLRSLTLEQDGSADEDEMGDVTLYVDGDEVDYDLTVDGDRYVFMFDGDGQLIEENDNIEVSVEVNTDTGTDETVRFILDDASDIYVLGKDYGYGLPIDTLTNSDRNEDGDLAVIQAGTVRSSRVSDFNDEVVYGDDRVIGALEVEFEGEDIVMEDLDFTVELSNINGGTEGARWVSATDNSWEDADVDELELTNVRLFIDGDPIAFAADDIVFDEPTSAPTGGRMSEDLEFTDLFTIDVRGEREVVFEIVADLDDAWSSFDGAGIQVTLTNVGEAEGDQSEKDYTASGEYFHSDRAFEDVTVKGNLVEFDITRSGVVETTLVAGTEDVVFGTLEIDAGDSVDDVEIKKMQISFTGKRDSTASRRGDLSNIDNCRVLDADGEPVADQRGSLSGTATSSTDVVDQLTFSFDDGTVEAGEDADLDIVCNIDDDANPMQKYEIRASTANEDQIEYEIGGDKFDYPLTSGDRSTELSISESGSLQISTDNPDDDNPLFTVATGSGGTEGVQVLDIEFEANEEDIRITDMYLADVTLPAGGTTVNRNALEEVIERMAITMDGSTTTARPRDYSSSVTVDGSSHSDVIEFENVNGTVTTADEMTATLSIDFNGIDRNEGQAGQYLQAGKLVVVWEGEESGVESSSVHMIRSGIFSQAVTFPTKPTVSANDRTQTLSEGSDEKLYEFTVAADNEGDVYLAQVAFTVNVNGVTLSNVDVHRGDSCSGTAFTNTAASVTAGTHKFAFTDVENIDAGDSQTYSVCGDVGPVTDNDSISFELADDNTSGGLGRTHSVAVGASNFVWSPNTFDGSSAHDGGDGSTNPSNMDWFNGWSVFDSGDVEDWVTRER